MASEAPPEPPPASAPITTCAEGSGIRLAVAKPPTSANPPMFTIAVKTKALARRVAYPPRKSLVPHNITAARLKATDWLVANTLDERITQPARYSPTD